MINNARGILFVILLLGRISATTWYVHPDSAINSIQSALDSCADNDTVLVGPGIYHENLVWHNVGGITLCSELGPDTTVIDGDSVGDVIQIDSCSAVDTTTVIDGFTIKNGSPNCGICCYAYDGGSSPTIANNIFTANVSGIWCSFASPMIIGNMITNNGNGINLYASQASIINNDISMNAGHGIGGYIFAPTIIGNTISQNTVCGVYGWYAYPIISNTTISQNASHGMSFGDGSPSVDHCIISGNGGHGITFDWAYITYPEIHYSDILDNVGLGINNSSANNIVNAINTWWGDATGPYHPLLNPGGLGEAVSDYVDFDPWLTAPVCVEEQPIVKPIETMRAIGVTIFRGPLQLPEGKKCKVFDITGRVVEPGRIQPGIYFIEVNGVVTQKVVKVR